MDRLENLLENILIKTEEEIKSRLEEVSISVPIQNTEAIGYCHCIKIDANGNLRLDDFIEFIGNQIVDYAIPKKMIDEAREKLSRTGSTKSFLDLRAKAKALFTDLKKTGEGGEILLYILTQEYLKYPQLLSKMSLKTSGEMHYHGADGIHVNYNKQKKHLELYWAESKMYKDLGKGIGDCFDSLYKFLLDPQGYKSTQERDLQLITSNISQNINNEELENLLVRYFDKDDDLSNNLIYKGICFIGFDYDKYPLAGDLTKTTQNIKDEILKQQDKWYLSCNYPLK